MSFIYPRNSFPFTSPHTLYTWQHSAHGIGQWWWRWPQTKQAEQQEPIPILKGFCMGSRLQETQGRQLRSSKKISKRKYSWLQRDRDVAGRKEVQRAEMKCDHTEIWLHDKNLTQAAQLSHGSTGQGHSPCFSDLTLQKGRLNTSGTVLRTGIAWCAPGGTEPQSPHEASRLPRVAPHTWQGDQEWNMRP